MRQATQKNVSLFKEPAPIRKEARRLDFFQWYMKYAQLFAKRIDADLAYLSAKTN